MTIEGFGLRLFIGIGIMYLVQLTLSALGIKEPANRAIFIVALLVILIFIFIGGAFIHA